MHELIDFEIFTETLFENLKIRDEGGKQLLFCKNSLSTVGKVDQPFFEILKFFLTSYVQVQDDIVPLCNLLTFLCDFLDHFD